MNSYINKQGVSVLIQRYGVLLSYPLDSKEEIEVFFDSEPEALKAMKVTSLKKVNSLHLITYNY